MLRHAEDQAVRSRHGGTVDHEGSYAIVTFGACAVPAVSSSPIAVLSRQLAPLGGVVAPQARGGFAGGVGVGAGQPRMTRPLGSTPITRASSLLQAGPPTDTATVLTPSQSQPLGTLPLAAPGTDGVGSCLLTFHAEAADQARVASMPDTTWPIDGHPPDSSRDQMDTPVSMSPDYYYDTSPAIRFRSPS